MMDGLVCGLEGQRAWSETTGRRHDVAQPMCTSLIFGQLVPRTRYRRSRG